MSDDDIRNGVGGAYWYALANVPLYSSKYSKQRYNQHQLFMICALKSLTGSSYRGVAKLDRWMGIIRQITGMKGVPHHSTVQRASRKMKEHIERWSNERA